MCPKILMRRCFYREGELRTWVPDHPDKSNPLGVALANGDVPAFYKVMFRKHAVAHTHLIPSSKRGDVKETPDPPAMSTEVS